MLFSTNLSRMARATNTAGLERMHQTTAGLCAGQLNTTVRINQSEERCHLDQVLGHKGSVSVSSESKEDLLVTEEGGESLLVLRRGGRLFLLRFALNKRHLIFYSVPELSSMIADRCWPESEG